MIRAALKKAVGRQSLGREEMQGVMEQIMTGGATDAQIGAFLTALAMKGESVDEITGAASVMRAKAAKVPLKHSDVVDTCGTGGDGAKTFNISTAAAFAAAGAGVRVAKHGNRAVSSACGSADVLKALGVNIELPPEKVGECIDSIGIGFLFATVFHSAMKYAIGPRREMGLRTIFNILGPLTNPTGAKRQITGIFSPDLLFTIAAVLQHLGSTHVMVVHGNGMDEITPCGQTEVAELKNNKITTYKIAPREFGMAEADVKDLAGGDAEENAGILRRILKGEKGPRRDAVLLNAAAAIYVAGLAENLKQGIEKAAHSIDSGAAEDKLALLAAFK
jgi:anthranilate phosphoribosyltransferase